MQRKVDLLGETSREQLENKRTLQLALTRLVEIVGKAANRVSKTTQGDIHKFLGARF